MSLVRSRPRALRASGWCAWKLTKKARSQLSHATLSANRGKSRGKNLSINRSQNMRISLKGINCKRKQLADGTWRTYYWAWKGGPSLRGEPGTPEFIASYNQAVARKVVAPQGVLLALLQGYQ